MTQQGDMTSQPPGPSEPGGSADVTAPAIASQPGSGTPTAAAAVTGAAGPAAPYWPSPYLAEGQSVPDAYPAPARPGQPRYGEPASQFLAGSQARFGRGGYGQSRPATAQAAVAGPAAAGPDAVPAAGADLPVASAWERLLAMTMDWLLILGASYLLLSDQMTHLIHRFQAAMLALQALGPDAQATGLTNFEKDPATVSALVSYFALVFLIALAYFWALEARSGATLGKLILSLRVVQAPQQSRPAVWATGVRTILFLAGPAIFAFASSYGLSIVALLGAAIWFADSLVLATDSQKRALHDKLAGTIVVRKAPRRGAG